ncbi:copper amine oxidase N-terminal domain-containing protein [Paenibacillus sp. CAU 1782]
MHSLKRTVALTFAMLLLLGLIPAGVWAADASKPTVVNVKTQAVGLVFDGQELKLPEGQHSFIYQGRVYLPIRYISYALQQTVGWDGKKLQVTVDEPNEKELEELQKQLLNNSSSKVKDFKSVNLPVRTINATLLFNGTAKTLPEGQSLFIYSGTIYVPVRFLAEAIGTEMNWDPVSRTVNGESEAYRAQFNEETVPGKPGGNNGGASGENGGAGTQPVAGGGAGGGGVPAKLTYEQITASAQSSLETLRDSCKATLIGLGLDYYATSDAAAKAQIKAQISKEVDSCTSKFESLLSSVSASLTANGYSTDIIEEYRKAFQAELAAGRAIAGNLG